jgi:hypothetical protein
LLGVDVTTTEETSGHAMLLKGRVAQITSFLGRAV